MAKLNFNEISRYNHDPKSDTYIKIKQILEELVRRGLFQRFDSECIAAADILQHNLAAKGISSRLVECQLSIVNWDKDRGLLWRFVGFSNNLTTQGVDTHVVVITDEEKPWLIDLSIANTISGDRPWVIEPLKDEGNLIISRYKIDELELTYHPKLDPRLIGLHQKTLLDRINGQVRIENQIKKLKFILAFLIVVASLNFIRGGYDFYQTYIVDDNHWGPAERKSLR
jgi:hypothetical protein